MAGNVTAGADVVAELDIGAGRDADITRNVNAGASIVATLDVDAGRNVNAGGIITAIGEIFGANGTAANAATMLGQFGGKVTVSGPNTAGHFSIPLWTGTGVQLVYVQFGSVQPGGGFAAGSIVPVSFPVSFPTIVAAIMVDSLVLAGGAQAGTVIFGSTANFGFEFQCGSGGNTGGFYWFAVGI